MKGNLEYDVIDVGCFQKKNDPAGSQLLANKQTEYRKHEALL